MNKGKATCEVLKGIRLQIARENCIEYQTEECQFEGNCSGTCPKCEADIRFLEKELVKQNKLGKAVVIAGLSVGLLGGLTGCGQHRLTHDNISKNSNSKNESVSNIDTISNINVKNEISTEYKCNTSDKNIQLEILEGDFINTTSYTMEILEMFDETYYTTILDEIEGDIDRPIGLIETMPEFPGGSDSLQLYLKNNIKFPESTRQFPNGVVLIQFAVEKDGSISNVKPIVKVHPDLDAEAVRVIENMPKWTPGRQQGKPVRVYYQIPIRVSYQ